jgi:hypothetical protein
MHEHDEHAEWPTLDVKRTGAYLYASNGKIVCVVKPDGTREWSPGMEHETISSWESFGVYDPIQQKQLEIQVDNIIQRFVTKPA